MTVPTPLPSASPVEKTAKKKPEKPRSRWQQYLIQVEKGFRQSFRIDSTFFVHFFLGSIILAAGMVLSLNVIQWSLIILAVTWVISAGMFQQLLQAIWEQVSQKLETGSRRILAIGTAAVFVSFIGAGGVILAILSTRFYELFLS